MLSQKKESPPSLVAHVNVRKPVIIPVSCCMRILLHACEHQYL